MKKCKWDRGVDFDSAPILTDKKNLEPNDIKSFLSHLYQLRYNIVTGTIEVVDKDGEWVRLDDRRFHSIYQQILDRGGKISESGLHSILNSDFVDPYHPFRKYFSSLSAPDPNTDYIQLLADKVITNNRSYWEKCLRKWLVAAVACCIDDSVINHTVLILKGGQGIGKSTFLLNLVPPALKNYTYSGVLNPADKDTMTHLSECLLINLDELEALSKYKEAAVKEIITKSDIRIRRPYSRFAEKMVRRASFTGSVNHGNILHDSTGSRRFLVHQVEKLDYEHSIDMDLVWSQAYQLYKNGFRFYFDMNEIEAVNKVNKVYEVSSTEEELLLENFEPAAPGDPRASKMTATQILKHLNGGDLPSNRRSATTTLGQALSKHNFEFKMNRGAKYYLVKSANHFTSIDYLSKQQLFGE